ncbi:MAG: hypothetical protein C4539_08955 [Ignavibacteriales bacterium]|nr:MAG: hypothetical protein C4539_08955 [Ignavibacteriales bacterium]
MADVQKENGFTSIANELVESFAKIHLSSRESQIVWAILRKTYGWKKKEDRISFSQLEELTNIHRRHIAPSLRNLIERNIISKIGEGQKLIYGIQKDYDLWDKPLPLSIKVNCKETITPFGNAPLPKSVTKPLPLLVNTKERKKYLKKIDVFFIDLIPEKLKTDEFIKSWKSWISYRKEIKKKITQSTAIQQLKKLCEYETPVLVIEQSIEKGWQGLFPVKQLQAEDNKPLLTENYSSNGNVDSFTQKLLKENQEK